MKLIRYSEIIFTVILFAFPLSPIPVRSEKASSGNSQAPTTLVYPPFSHCFGLHRVGQTHLNLYSGYKKKFKSPQGMAAVKLIFNDKKGPGDDDELTVYGVNSGTGEIIYNKSLISLGFFGGVGRGDGEFLRPTGIAADTRGMVVVADTDNDRLVLLENVENELHFQNNITLADTRKPFSSPSGVAMGKDSIYVADTGNDRIVVLDKEGKYVRNTEASGNLYGPFGIAIIEEDSWNHYFSRFIVLTDSLYQRLIVANLDGRVKRILRYREISDKPGGFFYVAIDHYSNIYVTDKISGCLYKFDRNLKLLARIFCHGESGIELEEPTGIAIYRRFGQIFIAEKTGASYFWVGTDLINLSCKAQDAPGGTILHVNFLLTETSIVTARIEEKDGNAVEVIMNMENIPPGNVKRIYQVGKNLLPLGVAKCDYLLSVEAKPTYSAKKHLTVRKTVAIMKLHN